MKRIGVPAETTDPTASAKKRWQLFNHSCVLVWIKKKKGFVSNVWDERGEAGNFSSAPRWEPRHPHNQVLVFFETFTTTVWIFSTLFILIPLKTLDPVAGSCVPVQAGLVLWNQQCPGSDTETWCWWLGVWFDSISNSTARKFIYLNSEYCKRQFHTRQSVPSAIFLQQKPWFFLLCKAGLSFLFSVQLCIFFLTSWIGRKVGSTENTVKVQFF